MKVVIVEDEIAASEHLSHLIQAIDPDMEIIKVLDSVKSCIAYFSQPTDAALVFMDIHLADGISFEIFSQVDLEIPIIFTTAYDQYALKAFKVNSIDYILKPVHREELAKALLKFKNWSKEEPYNKERLEDVLQLIQQQHKAYRSNYLMAHRDELIPVKVEDIAYFYIDTGVVRAITFQAKAYMMDTKLEDLEKELDPAIFDRANRQFVINRKAIAKIKYYFGGKLIVNVIPPAEERIVISKAKASQFKKWVNT
ncbi:LytTR family DNA-binding domain-containing protein [Flavobacteriaceae bacterium 3-367]|uniref:LytR/AlgR family response regulator transcription factor n=1 Tax=Eudoraea algarum TaxID=3417568 RepID=UPI00326F0314